MNMIIYNYEFRRFEINTKNGLREISERAVARLCGLSEQEISSWKNS